MHILVTGGAGYIGSHVCKALALNGATPVTLDNLSLGNKWAALWGPLIVGDISDKELLNSLCKEYQFQGVIHLAALSNIRESQQTPLTYYRNNVGGSAILLEVVREHKIPYFVQSSSCAIYGMPEQIPIDETHPKVPINPYGTSKWMVEQILQSVGQSQGIKIAILRYFNAAGADLDGEIGEAHDPETHLIPLLIQTALKKRPSFTLFGSDHETSDGTPIRDFIHVTDLAMAHVRALEWMVENGESLTLNLGSGSGYSVAQVIDKVERTLGCAIPIEKGERFAGDPPILVANPKKAIDTLKWQPRYSDLSTIINTAWRWHKER